MISESRGREGGTKGFHVGANLLSQSFIFGLLNDLIDPVGEAKHFIFAHAPAGDRGRSDANPAGIERSALIEGNAVGVADDPRAL